MRRMLAQLLEADGYEAERRGRTPARRWPPWSPRQPDLVLLDVVLGQEDGRELLLELRALSDVPVVFLTGRGLETDRIAGLRMGADDYVVKPFSPGELAARIESVLRRCRPVQPPPPVTGGLSFGTLRIDRRSREVELRHRPHRPHGQGVRPAGLPGDVTPSGVFPPATSGARLVLLL